MPFTEKTTTTATLDDTEGNTCVATVENDTFLVTVTSANGQAAQMPYTVKADVVAFAAAVTALANSMT